jgi:hypothetical protein
VDVGFLAAADDGPGRRHDPAPDGTTGATETVDTTGPDDFRGFIANQPIAAMFVDAPEIDPPVPGESQDRWATLDNLVVGSVTP